MNLNNLSAKKICRLVSACLLYSSIRYPSGQCEDKLDQNHSGRNYLFLPVLLYLLIPDQEVRSQDTGT